MPWSENEWDQPGYNPKNGKVRGLFYWEDGSLFNAKGKIAPLFSFARPHSRAFHFAWFCFFICFIMWFAIAPLMPTVIKPKCASADSDLCKDGGTCASKFPNDDRAWAGESKKDPLAPAGALDLQCKVCYPFDGRTGAGCGGVGMTPQQAKNTTLIGIAGTIILRIFIGAIADGIGIRTAFSILLILASIPGFILAASQDYVMIAVFRFLVGFAGGAFVLTQLWTTTMFDLNCVGVANATSAGWGNLGGGVAQILNGAVFAAMKASGHNNELSWRITLVWSPAVLFLLGVLVFFFTDDTPYGNLKDVTKKKTEAEKKEEEMAAMMGGGEAGTLAAASLIDAACTWQTWVLHLCYMFSFGVELIVAGNIVTYFTENWALPQTKASLIGSIFGLLNIFARTLGGLWSDKFNQIMGVRGRIVALFIQTLIMGTCLIIFSSLTPAKTGVGGMIASLVFWGFFTNVVEGGTFAVTPYVNPTAMGGVTGIVGAGGNVGALLGNFLIVGLKSGSSGGKAARNLTFCALGWASLASACTIPMLWLPGIGSMLRRSDVNTPNDKPQVATLSLPGPPMPQFIPQYAAP